MELKDSEMWLERVEFSSLIWKVVSLLSITIKDQNGKFAKWKSQNFICPRLDHINSYFRFVKQPSGSLRNVISTQNKPIQGNRNSLPSLNESTSFPTF